MNCAEFLGMAIGGPMAFEALSAHQASAKHHRGGSAPASLLLRLSGINLM
jgi:hypothetical protein